MCNGSINSAIKNKNCLHVPKLLVDIRVKTIENKHNYLYLSVNKINSTQLNAFFFLIRNTTQQIKS